ncbi:MAG: hypothetical protein AAGA48_08495 [Myxococcota bacterium]
MLTFITGLAAGALHVVMGPDHLAALAPIALQSRARGVRVGAQWGAGHGLGVVLIGLVGIGLRHLVDPMWLSAVSEWLVGFALIGVGVWALWSARTDLKVATHVHESAAVGMGLLHGAAGAGHLYGLLPALVLPPAQVVLYLGAYLTSAILAMAAFGGLLGGLAGSWPGVVRGAMGLSGFIAIVVGLFWLSTGLP